MGSPSRLPRRMATTVANDAMSNLDSILGLLGQKSARPVAPGLWLHPPCGLCHLHGCLRPGLLGRQGQDEVQGGAADNVQRHGADVQASSNPIPETKHIVDVYAKSGHFLSV